MATRWQRASASAPGPLRLRNIDPAGTIDKQHAVPAHPVVVQRGGRMQADQAGHPKADSWEDRPLTERCIMGFNAGPPITPSAYNNNLQIVQTPTYLMIMTEMVHEARIIPLDGRPHGNLPRWTGDSRGHWEGDTLVVNTKNFKRETALTGSSATTTLVERFRRVDANTIAYDFTVTDPNMYTRPWSASMPLRAIDERVFEYACHEGNHGLEGILRGNRYREKVEAEKAGEKK